MTDPIADMLTRIRNAIAAGKTSVAFPHSKIKQNIAQILKDHGYIADFSIEGEGVMKRIDLQLASDGQMPSIQEIARLSKPGRRIYSSSKQLPRILNGRGIVIVSTSGGLMTGNEARKKGLGGELICKVW